MVLIAKATGLAALAALTLITSWAWAGEGSESKVKIELRADKIDGDGKQKVEVTVTVEKGWHIYANPQGVPGMENNATTLKVKANGKLLNVAYPPGKEKMEGSATFLVYDGKVTIPASVAREANGEPLELLLQVNACTKGLCLPTGKIKIEVK